MTWKQSLRRHHAKLKAARAHERKGIQLVYHHVCKSDPTLGPAKLTTYFECIQAIVPGWNPPKPITKPVVQIWTTPWNATTTPKALTKLLRLT